MSNVRNPRVSEALSTPIVAHPTGGRTALAQGVGAVAEMGANMMAESVTTDLQDELFATQEAFLNNPENTAPDPDPLMELDLDSRNAAKSFAQIQARLQDAADQGTVPITELKIRQERILRDYMKRYPKLTPMFQRAASGVLGYNPIGAEISAIQQSTSIRQSQVQAIYERVIKAADSAGINPMLQLTNPNEYWNRVGTRLEEADQAAKLDRDLKTAEALDQLNARTARRMIRGNMGGLTASVIEDISGVLNTFSTMPFDQRGGAASQGMFDQLRDGITLSRSKFVSEFYNDYFVNSDMTMEQLEAELKPVLDIYDYAASNVSDEKLMEKVNQLNTVAKSSFFLSYPDLARLNYMADILNSPTVASAIQTNRELQGEIAESLGNILNQSMGGRAPAGAFQFPAADNNGVVNPAAARAQLLGIQDFETPEKAGAFFDGHIAIVASVLDRAYQAEDPNERNIMLTQTAAQLTAFANTYLEADAAGRGLMPRDVVGGYLALLSDPTILPVWAGDKNKPIEGVNRQRIAESVKLMINTEQYGDIAELTALARQALTSTHTSILGTVTQGVDLVTPMWDEERNRPYYELNEAAWDELGTYGNTATSSRYKDKKDIKDLITKLNNHPAMNRYAMTIMASAHLNGHTGYAQEFDETMLYGVLGINPER